MAARRRGRRWASSRRPRAQLVWFGDSVNGTSAPGPGNAVSENLLDAIDYTVSPGHKERVRVRRVLVDLVWSNDGTPSTTANAVFNIDVALFVATPDERAAIVTAGVSIAGLMQTGARVIRARLFNFSETHAVTGVGLNFPRSPLRLNWNLKANIRLTEPQALYLYMARGADISGGPSDSYEYSYRSRVLFER